MKTILAGARMGAILFALACFSLASWQARATHEMDHRYFVQGYVLDEQRKPRQGVSVSLSKDRRFLGQSITDSRGRFSILAHLHDPDIGALLELRAGNRGGEIRMQAIPGDATTRRVHHVNFIGNEVVERDLDAGGLAWWPYAAGGAVIVPAIVALVFLRRKKKAKAGMANRHRADSKKRRAGKKKKKMKKS